MLLEQGADVNAADRPGQTPLMFAAAADRDAWSRRCSARRHRCRDHAVSSARPTSGMGELRASRPGIARRLNQYKGGPQGGVTAMGGMTALNFAAREDR